MTGFGAYAESLYQQVLPLHGPDPQGLAHDYVAAVAQPMREIDELVRDTPNGTGWSIILDVDDAPVKGLWWLSQLAGVKLRQKKTITAYNLVNYNEDQNGSFETVSNVSNWAYANTALTRVIGGTAGSYMVHARATSNATAGIAYTVDTGENARSTWAIDVLTCSRAVSLQVEFLDVSFATISTVTQAASATHGRRSMTTVSPAGTEYTVFSLIMPGALTNETFEADAASAIAASSIIDSAATVTAGIGDSAVYFDGFRVTRIETDDEWGAYARDAIKRQGGKRRGTSDAILSAAEDTLSPGAVARLTERVGGNANALTLTTRPSETPDPTATLAAANAQKPFGKKITHVLTQDLLIDEESGTIDTATGTIDVPT